jgi:hypothetical protein
VAVPCVSVFQPSKVYHTPDGSRHGQQVDTTLLAGCKSLYARMAGLS